MWEYLCGHYWMRVKPELARLAEGFTTLRVIFLTTFIDLTHENILGLWKLV